MSERDHIISAPEGDLHRLSVRRLGPDIFITTNGRELWPSASTALSDTMAQQLCEGIQAVLSGAPRACTPIVLRMEQEDLARRAQRAPASTPAKVDLSAYDNLFGD